jgi:nucleotide-binding universal stress UspA family protein
MAIKDVLFHLDTSDAADSVSEFASSLAARTGAHLTAAGIAIEYLALGGMYDASSFGALAEITEESRKAAEKAYVRFAAAAPAGVETELMIIQTLSQIARDEFGQLARHFDLSVVGQGGPESGPEDHLMVEGALFGSGRPVFVVPPIHKGPAKLDTAMVCWDGGAAAARALAEALPFLSHARQVEVVSVCREDEPAEELPGFNITRHLARHGITATLRKLPPTDDVGAAILSHAADSGADYIVMGGYGHWRLRELILGGTTRTILASMTVPVFIAH